MGITALVLGELGLGVLIVASRSPYRDPAPLITALLPVVALGLGLVALTRTDDRWFIAFLATTALAALVPAPFPPSPMVPLLVVVPALLLVYVEIYLLQRRLSMTLELETEAGTTAARSILASAKTRLPRAAVTTLSAGAVAILLPLVARWAPADMAWAVERSSVYGLVTAAAILLALFGIAFLRRLRQPRNRSIAPVATLLIGGLAVILLMAGPTGAQTGSADLALEELDFAPPVVNTTTTVQVTIANHGPDDAGPVTVELSLDGEPIRQDGNTLVFLNISAGANATRSLEWRPDPGQAGDHDLTARITTRQPGHDPDPSNDLRTRPVLVQLTGLSLELLDGEAEKRTHPDERVAYRFHLTNTGNGPDRANITLAPTNQSWTTTLAGDTDELAPGERREVLVILRAPAQAEPDDGHVGVNITAASAIHQQARRTSDPPVPVIETATPDTKVILERLETTYQVNWTAPTSSFIEPGQRIVLPLELTNNGDGEDLVDITLNSLGATGGAWNTSLERTLVALRPGEVTTVNATFQAPAAAGPGDRLRLNLTATSEHPPHPDPFTSTVELTILASGADLVVQPPALGGPVYRGSNLTAEIQLHNAGNRVSEAARFNLSLTHQGSGEVQILAEREVAPIEPGAAETIRVRAEVAAQPGSGTLEARLEETVLDIEPTNNQATLPVLIRLAQIGVVPAEGLTGSAGEALEYTTPPNVFTVVNDGNADENVTVTIASEHGWLEDTRRISLPAGGQRRVPVTLTIPDAPGTFSDALTVTAVLDGFPAVGATNVTTTQLTDRHPPRILEVDLPPVVPLDASFDVTADVRDDIAVGDVRIQITRPDGTSETQSLERGDDGLWTRTLRYAAPGPYTATIIAEDRRPQTPHETRSDAHPFNVTFVDPPSIELASLDADQPISSGTPIQFNITSRVPIGIVSATHRGQTTELTPPYEVDTSTWPHGGERVLIRAEDVFGNAAEETFELTVDNRVPEIISFNHERLGEGPDGVKYRFTLRTKGAQSADLVVRGDGIPDDAHPFSGTGDRFQLTTSLPPGQLEVTGQVYAATGLTNASQPLRLGGEDAFGVPGVGMLGTLAVLAAIVLGRARKRAG